MTKLERISREVETLGPAELAKFRAWFAEYDTVQWDAQIESDAVAGRLDELAEAALKSHRAGQTRAL